MLVIENRLRVGGVSVHTGTIPSKTLRETVLNLSGWRERGFYGLAYRVKKDIEGKDLGVRLRMTLDHEIEVLEHQFARNGVKTFAGVARFADPHRLVVKTSSEEHSFDGDKIVIAVGTAPFRPPDIPFNDRNVFDSDDIATEPHVPRSLTVVGAGVIGIEYATIFSALDVPVTIIEPRENFLEFIDREIIDEFVHDLRKRGIQFRLGAKVERVELDEQGYAVSFLSDGRRVRTEMLLYAAGRVGATGTSASKPAASRPTIAGGSKVDPKTFQTSGAAHLRRRRRDRLPEPRLDLDGAGPHRRLPRLRRADAAGARVLSLRHLRGARDLHRRAHRGRRRARRASATRSASRRFRETSRGHIMGLESGMMKLLFALDDRKLLGVAHRRRRRDRAHPHRPGRAQPRRHHRLFRRERLQLSDARRRLQDRRARCDAECCAIGPLALSRAKTKSSALTSATPASSATSDPEGLRHRP